MVEVMHDITTPTVPVSIHDLPNEILIEIMENCMPDDNSDEPFDAALSTALTFASVCYHWRNTTISMPQLWTKIRLGSSRGRDNAPVMQRILCRSCNCDLQLLFTKTRSSMRTEKLLNAIKPHRNRIIHLTVDFGCDWITDIFVARKSFRRLTKLVILERMSGSTLIQAFRCCPALESASIRLKPARETVVSHQQQCVPATMAQLRRLSITYNHYHEPNQFFSFVTAPRLTNFVAFSTYGWTAWPHTAFMQFITRSQASLTVLNIEHDNLEPHHTLELINAAPSLKELHIYKHQMESIYKYLSFRDGLPVILPQLRALSIHALAKFMAPRGLYNMIESRVQESPLKEVNLIFRDQEGDQPDFMDGPFADLWEDAAYLGYTLECTDESGEALVSKELLHHLGSLFT